MRVTKDGLKKFIKDKDHPKIAKWYENYLSSKEWHAKRDAVKIRARDICEYCYEGGRVVHHLTYKRVTEETLKDLTYVCDDCHNYAHSMANPPFVERIYDENDPAGKRFLCP